ncbi:MAG: hypothetical protein QM783_18205 [Phycisphaerales bacterium]
MDAVRRPRAGRTGWLHARQGQDGQQQRRRFCRPGASAPAPAPAPKATPKAEPRPAPAPAAGSTTVYYPAGRAEGAALRLDRTCPSEVTAGQAFEYEIKVTNVSPVALTNVNVTETTPSGFRVTDTSVAGKPMGSASNFDLGDLAPGESKSIKFHGTAPSAGQFASCATASYVIPACCTINVSSPALKITKTAPAEVNLCDVIPVQIVVTNSGTGTARNVSVRDQLPADMMTGDGKNVWEANVGDLAAGASKTLNFNAKASKIGSYNNTASASAEGNLKADSGATTTVVKNCNLEITKTGPSSLYIGRDATYTITVKNSGNGVARNTVVEDPIPAGTSFKSATEGGALAGNSVKWNLGDMAAGSSKTLSVTLNSGTVTEIRNSATVTSVCCSSATANAVTAVAGVPAIVIELVDNPDPIEVGGETTFSIVVTNQGNKADSNVKGVFKLAPGLAFVSGNGDTSVTAAGDTITLGTVGTLAPKQTVRWTVRAKNTAANGDSRSNLSITSDYFKKAIVEEESTNLVK